MLCQDLVERQFGQYVSVDHDNRVIDQILCLFQRPCGPHWGTLDVIAKEDPQIGAITEGITNFTGLMSQAEDDLSDPGLFELVYLEQEQREVRYRKKGLGSANGQRQQSTAGTARQNQGFDHIRGC